MILQVYLFEFIFVIFHLKFGIGKERAGKIFPSGSPEHEKEIPRTFKCKYNNGLPLRIHGLTSKATHTMDHQNTALIISAKKNKT